MRPTRGSSTLWILRTSSTPCLKTRRFPSHFLLGRKVTGFNFFDFQRRKRASLISQCASRSTKSHIKGASSFSISVRATSCWKRQVRKQPHPKACDADDELISHCAACCPIAMPALNRINKSRGRTEATPQNLWMSPRKRRDLNGRKLSDVAARRKRAPVCDVSGPKFLKETQAPSTLSGRKEITGAHYARIR